MNPYHFIRDTKITVWLRESIQINAKSLNEALDELIDGSCIDSYDYEYLSETEEVLDPSENGNQATIEILTKNGELLYDNVKGKCFNGVIKA